MKICLSIIFSYKLNTLKLFCDFFVWFYHISRVVKKNWFMHVIEFSPIMDLSGYFSELELIGPLLNCLDN